MDQLVDQFCSSVIEILEQPEEQALQACKTPLEKCAFLEQIITTTKLDADWIAICQSFLGNMYAGGFDRKLHYDKARTFLAEAIASGRLDENMTAMCQCNLAGLYAMGHGGPVLKNEAKTLLHQAFDSGELDEELQEDYADLLESLEEEQ